MSGVNRPNFNMQGLMSSSSRAPEERTPSPQSSRNSTISTPPQGMSTPPTAMAGRTVTISTPPQARGAGGANLSTPPRAILGRMMTVASDPSTPPQRMTGRVSVPETPALARTRVFQGTPIAPPTSRVSISSMFSVPETPGLVRTRVFQRTPIAPPTSNLSHFQSSQASLCPPTPAHKRTASGLPERQNVRRPRMEESSAATDLNEASTSAPFLNEARRVATLMEAMHFNSFEITIGNRKIMILDRVQKLRKGEYAGHENGFNAYLVKVCGVDGHNLEDNIFVLQVFDRETLNTPKHALQLLEQKFQQYQQNRGESLSCLDFDIALAQGKEPAQFTHGCSLIKFVPHSYLAAAKMVTARMDAFEFFPFSLNIGNNRVEIVSIEERLGSGSYFDAYLVQGNGLKDKQFVLKALQQQHFNKPKEAIEALNNEFQRYQELKRELAHLGAHIIAPHFNFDMAIEQGKGGQNLTENFTDGCYLVQYVPNRLANYVVKEAPASKPYKFVQRRELYPPLSQLKSIDNQLKQLIEFAYHKNLPLDLTVGNVGFDDQVFGGQTKIVVYDPMVPDGKEHGDVGFMGKSLERSLKSFAPEGSDRSNYLDPREKIPLSV